MDASRAAPRYEIHVRGVLGVPLLAEFHGLSGHSGEGVTVLSGSMPDQAALYGVLRHIESLGLELLAVHRYPEPTPA